MPSPWRFTRPQPKKLEAEVISVRIENALLPDAIITLEEVRLLESDLNLLFKDIRSAVSLGIHWDKAHYGFEKQTFDTWRLNLLNLKQKLLKKIKDEEKAANDVLDIHKKTITPRQFPKIAPNTWHHFLYVFKQESPNYPLDIHKISIIRNALSNQLDKTACQSLNTLKTILH